MNARSTPSRHALVAAALSAPVLLAPVAVAAPAWAHQPSARPRPSAPVVTVEPTWRFDIGAQVDRTAAKEQYHGDIRVFHQRVPVELAWRGYARQGARIAGYDLFQHHPSTTQLFPLLKNSRATRYAFVHTDVAYPPLGGAIGPRLHPRFRLVAKDTAGRTTVVDPIQRHPVFSEQENGTTYQNGRSVFPRAPRPDRGWYRQAGPQYDAGSVLVSRNRGATVSIPVKAHRGGQWIALEMTTGPGLGVAEVRVDGHRVGTVDTRSRTTRQRVLVAEYLIGAGNHTVTVTNLGTHRRSTIELDGVFASD
jgi:hypothetical protein